jgi:hypothetical protein
MTPHLLYFKTLTGHTVIRKQDGEVIFSYINLLESDHLDDQGGRQCSSSPGAELRAAS